jgi:leader peptidase (prepilin peptidase)/N-methyltransferase
VRWRDNVPVVSWLALRGRCRDCGAPISALYPLVELLSGLLAWVLFRRLVPDPADLDAAHMAAWVVQFAFLALLVVAAFVDVRHRIIPDETSIYAVPIGIAGAVLLESVGWDGWLAIGWRQAVLGAAIWGGMFALFSIGSMYVTGQVALGWGDVKLAAMLGAFLGAWPGTLVVLIAGSVLGATVGIVFTVVQQRRVYLPFGPPLALAAAAYVLWGEPLVAVFFPHLHLGR